MTRLEQAFAHRPLLMPYYPVGFPNFDASLEVLEALAKNGADLLEIGLPFSDPLADGPVIQQAAQQALEAGFTTPQALEAVRELRRRGVGIPLILMGYYNPILSYGLEKFVYEARAADADGFIIPDLPPEEAGEFGQALQDAAQGQPPLPLITMLAPTTPVERIKKIACQARGFIYLVSVTGVTGARPGVPEGLAELISRVRQHTPLPVCVGFGIGTPEQAQSVAAMADGVIVGSACVRAVQQSASPPQAAAEFAARFARALKKI